MTQSTSIHKTIDVQEFASLIGLDRDRPSGESEPILDDQHLRSIRDDALEAEHRYRDVCHPMSSTAAHDLTEVLQATEAIAAILSDVGNTIWWSVCVVTGTVLAADCVTWAAALFLWR